MKTTLVVSSAVALSTLALAYFTTIRRSPTPSRPPEPRTEVHISTSPMTPATLPSAAAAAAMDIESAPRPDARPTPLRVVTESEGTKTLLDAGLKALAFKPMLLMASGVAGSEASRRSLVQEATRRLASASGEERLRLLALLVSLGDAQGLTTWLAEVSASPDPAARAQLARNAPTSGEQAKQVIEALFDRLANDCDGSVRAATLESMPRGLSATHMEPLLQALSRETDPDARKAVINYLSQDAPRDPRFLAECGCLTQDASADQRSRLLANAALQRAAR